MMITFNLLQYDFKNSYKIRYFRYLVKFIFINQLKKLQ